jgi:hypothetical protein
MVGPCIAFDPAGRRCTGPAAIYDERRAGWVCEYHLHDEAYWLRRADEHVRGLLAAARPASEATPPEKPVVH